MSRRTARADASRRAEGPIRTGRFGGLCTAAPATRDGRAIESSEEDALQRAERFLKLGFVVYAIKKPKGAVFMDEAQITDLFAERTRLAAAATACAEPRPNRRSPAIDHRFGAMKRETGSARRAALSATPGHDMAGSRAHDRALR